MNNAINKKKGQIRFRAREIISVNSGTSQSLCKPPN